MKFSLKKILRSFRYSLQGIQISNQEHNFRAMLMSVFFVILLGFVMKISYFEWLILILIMSIVLSLEALNTALEKMLDYLEPNLSDKIRIIKDLIAGSVAIVIFSSIIIGLLIFLPKIIILLKYYL
ncbi:MAG: diacylglycerol kinase family protein [Candidatus Paceibacterota bacterium]|jgi:diacylglycerol kinase